MRKGHTEVSDSCSIMKTGNGNRERWSVEHGDFTASFKAPSTLALWSFVRHTMLFPLRAFPLKVPLSGTLHTGIVSDGSYPRLEAFLDLIAVENQDP